MHRHGENHVMGGDTHPGGMLTGIVHEDALGTSSSRS